MGEREVFYRRNGVSTEGINDLRERGRDVKNIEELKKTGWGNG